MKIILVIVISFIFFKSFGQSITLLPNNVSSIKSNFNVLESSNETALTLKRSTPGFYTSLTFRDNLNEYLGGVSFGNSGALITASNTNGFFFRIGAPSVSIMEINPSGVVSNGKLVVQGEISSAELNFTQSSDTERRPVFADKDGILRVENSSNHYASYDFSAVQQQDWDDQLRKGSGLAWFNTTNVPMTMYLPVNLPDGVKVTNVRMYVLDNSTSNISFTFNRFSHTSTIATTIANAQSNSQVATLFSINQDADETINNASNSYYVNISSSGNWTGNTLAFHSLVITYQYQ